MSYPITDKMLDELIEIGELDRYTLVKREMMRSAIEWILEEIQSPEREKNTNCKACEDGGSRHADFCEFEEYDV